MCPHLQAPAGVVAKDDVLGAVVYVGPGLPSAARKLGQCLVPVPCALCSHMPHLHHHVKLVINLDAAVISIHPIQQAPSRR